MSRKIVAYSFKVGLGYDWDSDVKILLGNESVIDYIELVKNRYTKVRIDCIYEENI